MPRHNPLTPQLQAAPFSVPEARRAGFGRATMRNRELLRPFYGVRATPSALSSSIAGFVPRLRPHEWFSHESAARLWGVPLRHRPRLDDPVHVTIAAPGAASRTRGAQGHQNADAHAPVVRRFGVPCSDAASTWLSLAGILSVRELVVAGDHFVLDPEVNDRKDPRPYVTLDELRARTAAFHGPGKRRASEALELVRVGAESRFETLLRLLVRDARLPEPEVNPVIVDARGARIGRADLVFRSSRVIVEYDGDQHRTDKRQYRKDVTRWQRFSRAGWDVLRFHDDHVVRFPAVTQREIADALARDRVGAPDAGLGPGHGPAAVATAGAAPALRRST
ncbi:endonuclease domain-containing protein [Subtercola endophyticus]|uniref:endonuclease domain-containing protein n=1 Tax=Subtercola endophyticus TaxID=2895559 RepID=UPI001E313DD4|nr:DUF559 domain-containing protein [Subtercola endophyticus]UFS57890.1 endonuclease domain-containing protein [Subtercola endophyticus]